MKAKRTPNGCLVECKFQQIGRDIYGVNDIDKSFSFKELAMVFGCF